MKKILFSFIAASILATSSFADAQRIGPATSTIQTTINEQDAYQRIWKERQQFENESINMQAEAAYRAETTVTPTSINCIEGGCDIHRNGILVSFIRGQFPQAANGFQFDFTRAFNSEYLTATNKETITKSNNFTADFIKFVMLKNYFTEADTVTFMKGNSATLDLLIPEFMLYSEEWLKKFATFDKDKNSWIAKSEAVPWAAVKAIPFHDGFGKLQGEIFVQIGLRLQYLSINAPEQFEAIVKDYFDFKASGADDKFLQFHKGFINFMKQNPILYYINSAGQIETVNSKSIVKLIENDRKIELYYKNTKILGDYEYDEQGKEEYRHYKVGGDYYKNNIIYFKSTNAKDEFIFCKDREICEDNKKIKDRYYPKILIEEI